MRFRSDTICIFAITACLIGVGDMALTGPGWVWLISFLFMLPALVRILAESWAARPRIDRVRRSVNGHHDLLEALRRARPALPMPTPRSRQQAIEEHIVRRTRGGAA